MIGLGKVEILDVGTNCSEYGVVIFKIEGLFLALLISSKNLFTSNIEGLSVVGLGGC